MTDMVPSLANQELESIVAVLARTGIQVAYVERALDLPPGTIAHWRGARVPFEGLVLMRVVLAMPWILDVAAHGYDPVEARRVTLLAAAGLI